MVGVKTAVSLYQVRPRSTGVCFARFALVETQKTEAADRPGPERHFRIKMPGVRRKCPQITKTRIGAVAVFCQSLSMLRMRGTVPDDQVHIASAARRPVVTAPSMNGPNR